MRSPFRMVQSRTASFFWTFPFFVAVVVDATNAFAQVSSAGIGVVRHGLILDGSNRIEGSLQILTGESISLIGTPVISADLLVPGTPTIQFSGNPNYGGTLEGTGHAEPSNYLISGNGHFSLRHVVTRSNPVVMPSVAPPPLPTGTRNVTLSSAASNPGSFATIRNLTISGNAGPIMVPPGTYGTFSVSGKSSFTLGMPGATKPAVYNFQRLVFSGNDDLRIVGPVVITVNSGVTCGGRVGSFANPSWLKLRVAKGDVVLSGNSTLFGEVVAPNGTVHFNGNGEFIGGLACDRLVLDGNNLLRFLVLNTPPTAHDQIVPTVEDTDVAVVLEGRDEENDPLTYARLSEPAHGTLWGTAPNFTYRPHPNYYGPDSFTFKVADGQADSNVATVDITVTPVNDAPQADGQERATKEDVPLPVSLASQDIEGDSVTYRIVGHPTHGILEGEAPQLTYRPTLNFNGHDEFTFVVNDGAADSAPAAVAIEVGPVSDAPEGTNAIVPTDEDTPVSVVVGGTDADGDSLTYRLVAPPLHGVLSGTAPHFTYTPSLNHHGADEFTFRANDGWQDSDVARISIEVRPINDPPSAAEQNQIVAEDAELSLVLEGGDIDGDPLIYTVVLAPAHGTLIGTPPNLTYTPAADYNGPDSFTFKTNDGQIDSGVATVGITVKGEEDPPTAAGQELTTKEDTALSIALVGRDGDGDTLSFTITTTPAHGSLNGSPPNLLYTPGPDYNGPDQFAFKVSDTFADSAEGVVHIVVTPVNDAPVVAAGPEQTIFLPGGAAITGSARDDGSPPGASLSISWSSLSGPGTVTFQNSTALDTSVEFSTAGVYVLRLTATDSELASSADVTITVNPENQAPVVNAGADQLGIFPDPVALSGIATDDGNPVGRALAVNWSSLSGPGPVTFANKSSPETTVIFSVPGTYVLRLSASDTKLTRGDDVVVTVLPRNNAPVVNAGHSLSITLPDILQLQGTAGDDGLPTGSEFTINWNKVSGPGEVSFGNPSQAVTSAQFSAVGSYTLRLTASDSELTSTSDIVVVVEPPVNRAPTVEAGPPRTLNLYNIATLTGTITDDNLPNATLTVSWSKTAGPGDVVFSDPNTRITNAIFSKPGLYVLRLVASDSSLTSHDEVTINAAFQNQAPVVEAGENQGVGLNGIVALNGEVTDDGVPTGIPLVTTWSKASGPGTATFADTTDSTTTVTFSATGSYVLQLSASDSELTSVNQVTIEVGAACVPVPAALAGFWRGNGTGADSVGISDGTLLSNVSFAPGSVGEAFSLTGNNAVKVPSTSLTDAGKFGAFTVELWIKPVGISAAQPLVEWNNGTAFGAHLWISVGDQGVLFANIVDIAGAFHVISTPAGLVKAGSFQHVALTYDKATGLAALYRDGQMVKQQNLGSFTPRTSSDLYFGRRLGSHFVGLLDEISLYQRALRADEIQSIYHAGAGGKCSDSSNHPPIVQAGPEVIIPFEYVFSLQGSLVDDGQPSGSPLTATWSVVSGPGTVAFADGSSPSSPATFSAAGKYVLRLTGFDGDLRDSSDVTIVVLPAGQIVPPTVTIIPYEAEGWRYKIYPYGTVPGNVGAIDFDDSDYSIGKGAFGSGGGCAVQSTVRTHWPLSTEIVLRRVVELPQNISNVRVSGTVDNDVQVLINGVAASDFVSHEGCAQLDDTRINVLTTSLTPGPNVFVVRGRDRGGESYLDLKFLLDSPVTADAGPDATFSGGSIVHLDGSRSSNFSGLPMTYQWTQITGPKVALDLTDTVHPRFVGPSLSATTVLTFRLFVNDGGTTSNPDTVAITILPSGVTHSPPTVNAGADQTLQSSTANLQGTVTDDGEPSPPAIMAIWAAVSGPGKVTFSNRHNLATTAQFTHPGNYIIRLSADDSQLSASDDVVVTVPAGVNLPPSINAGPDMVAASSDAVNLNAAVADDGLPNGTVAVRWIQVSGPGAMVFANAFAASTAAHFTAAGAYVLRVSASDSALTATDDVAVTITAAGNQPPQADAGLDQTISVHEAATLNGTANDDGLPSGILAYRWASVTGPGSVSFNVGSGIVNATFSDPGQYMLRFAVSDSELTSTDDVTITVLGDNQPPVVSAGANQTIRQPNAATLNGSVSDDGLPVGNSVRSTWIKVSGPGDATFGNAAAPQTSATFSQPGAYVLQLSASDGILTAASTTIVTVSGAANAPPSISVTSPSDQSRALPGMPVNVTAQASDFDGNVANVSFFVNGAQLAQVNSAPYGFTWLGGPVGLYAISAVATDNEGAASSGSVALEVVGNSSAPPFLELLSPQSGDTITAPTVVIGTIASSILRSYVLQYRLKNEPCADWVTFGSGTAVVTANQLGVLDPTLLMNGTYEIRMVLTNLDGASYASLIDVVVDGNMKVGNFTGTFKDLELALSGVPITVTRTYDSRNHCPGDFGHGWTLDLDSIRLESTEQMGDAWSLFIVVGNPFDPSYYRLDDAGPHLVSLKMPDGQLFRFRPKLVMDRPYNRLASLLDADGDDIGQVYAPIQDDQPIKMIYRSRPGAEGAVLKARGYRTASVFGGFGTVSGDTQLFLADTFEGAISLATRPGEFGEAPAITGVTGWELTLRDGRVLLFDAEGKLEEMRDRVGNKVTFNRHSSGKIERITHTPSGKEIVFTRDGANRIKSITDPAGSAVQYRYTPNGDLDAVFERGNDPVDNTPNTRFSYKGVTHLLEDVLDARGLRAANNFYDDTGRLFKTTDAAGNETTFTHDLNTRTETIKDRAGNITVHRYDERGNVIETRAPDGTLTASDYHRWSDGTLSELKQTESITGLFTNEANPAGPLVMKTVTTHYSYEDDDPVTPPLNDGLLRKLVDPKGNTTTFTYDGRGNVLTVTDAKANAAGGTPAASVVNTYYANGLLETAIDALGNVVTYTHDGKGNPDKETRTVTLTNADGASNLVSVVTDRDYNALGQLETLTDAAGHLTTYEYDANGNRRFERTTRNSAGATIPVVTETEYDEQDRPVRTWNADNPRAQATRPSSETVYDGNGKVEWTYDALGRGTHQEYDSRGLPCKTTHPDATFETVTYDPEGRREIATDRRGKATKTVYDMMGRVSETIFLGGTGDAPLTLSTTHYDAAGRVWQSTDANNHTTSYGYDDAGRRVIILSPPVPIAGGGTVSPTTHYSYDANGNLRFVTDPKGLVTEHVYDASNRRRQTILPPAALDLNGDGIIGSGEQSVISILRTDYDELGRRVSETDASNRTKRYGYDVLGRLRHVLDYVGQATRFDYDELGNQLSQTDANNHTTRYTYDNAGRRITRTLPLAQQELLSYDGAGNLETRRDFNGRTTTFQYDPMNRLRFKIPDASLGEPTIQFTYNDNGQRETMDDATGTTVYGYDGRGQLRTKQTPFGTLSYDYYPNRSLKQMRSSNANGINVAYGYDALNRLQTVGDANAGPTSYGYDANGNLETVLYPNGVSHVYGYSPLNRLTGLSVSGTSGMLASFGYTATPAGQRTSVSEGNGRTAGYGYETLGRLQRETITGSPDSKNGIAIYGYDNVGNRLTRTSSIPGITNQTFSYDWNDRLNGDQYDSNGNPKSAPVSQPLPLNSQQVLGTDNYDSENRLIQRTGTNGSNITLVYDGDGNRVQEIVNGQITSYLVDDRNPTGYAQVVEEIVGGVVNHTYTFGHDLISQDQFDSTTGVWRATFYGYDGRGTVRFLTDETGAVSDMYTYDAFGTLITAAGSTNNRYLYSGEQFDPNLGLYYLRARLMNPLTGRFWTMDSHEGPQTDSTGLHKYLYGNDDPTNRADPTGHFSTVETALGKVIIATITGMQINAGKDMLLQGRRSFGDEGELFDDALLILDSAQFVNDTILSVRLGKVIGLGSAAILKSTHNFYARISAAPLALPAPSSVPNAGGVIRSFLQETDRIYYRVFSGSQRGGFLTAIPPKSAAWAREALALPPGNQASYLQEVIVPAGTRLQRSRALPNFGKRGGAEQFEVLDRIPDDSFGIGVELQ